MNNTDKLIETSKALNEAALDFAANEVNPQNRPAHETGIALALQRAAIRYARAVDKFLEERKK